MLKRAALCMAACACAPALSAALPLPSLNCTLSDGGETTTAIFGPSAEPYAVQAVNTHRFRVKAIVSKHENASVLVKVYTYYRSGRQYRPLHLEKLTMPLKTGAQPQPQRLGEHHLYSPELGRELVYECRLEWPDRSAP
jgi:hypothetical protein